MTNNYNAPLEEIKFLLKYCLKIDELLVLTGQTDPAGLADAILEGAAGFAKDELAPLNAIGDKLGCKFSNGNVTTPPGFKEAYSKFIAGGWNGLPFPAAYGGQDLPWLLGAAVAEIWNGANMAFGLCPLLTQGAVESLLHHGSKAQQDEYLPQLISGQWTGTMCLTETQAGSDLAAIRTKAVANGDHYLISGQKIFITYGEHDFTKNIIHMVLARIPGSPDGVKGISLFIVPKFLKDGSRNDVGAISIEHKMGIHASPTAILSFGEKKGAVGYLVGKENEGLKYMFTMMNNARLSVAVEGLGISESSYQMAYEYALNRVQGKVSGVGGTIINHPDVKRMLLTIKAQTTASRAIIYYAIWAMDIARHHKDANTRQRHQDIVDLLTPIAKAHATELGFNNASMALQVFGGAGYITETGIEQNLRDARIAMIYEGTNGIQAMDLAFRKLILHDGRLVESLLEELPFAFGAGTIDELSAEYRIINECTDKITNACGKLQQLIKNEPEQAGMVASGFLRLFAIAFGGILLNKQLVMLEQGVDLGEEFVRDKKEVVGFYNRYLLGEVDYLLDCL